MKTKSFKIFIFLVGLLFLSAACSPSPSTATPDIPATAEILAEQMQTATAASLPPSPTLAPPTATLVPAATMTMTPTATQTPQMADYSQIKYLKAQSHYAPDGTLQSVFILEVGNLQGSFDLVIRGHIYQCQRFDEFPGQIWCYGPYLPPGYQGTMDLYPAGADYETAQAVYHQVFGFPVQPTPTLFGVTCIYEPLSAIGQSTDSSCYAITCTYQGRYYGGTKNSCTDPWP